MKLLAIDTATVQATVAVASDGQIIAQAERTVDTHSQSLIGLIDDALTAAHLTIPQLDAIVCGQGPGSFTGVRIGLATAKGLCLASGRPLICIPTFFAIAESVYLALADSPPTHVWVLLDARRHELYVQQFAGRTPVGTMQLLSPARIVQQLNDALPSIIAGNGIAAYPDLKDQLAPHHQIAPPDCHRLSAKNLFPEALKHYAAKDFANLMEVEPIYLRDADARLPAVQQKTPLQTPLIEFDLEKFRQAGISLDADGHFWHEGTQITHPGLVAALHRWIDQLPDGRFILRLDDKRYVYLDVLDAPRVVRQVTKQADTEDTSVFQLVLSDNTTEPLHPHTLCIGDNNVLYCRVHNGFSARFSRAAYYQFCEHVELIGDPTKDAFAVKIDGKSYSVSRCK